MRSKHRALQAMPSFLQQNFFFAKDLGNRNHVLIQLLGRDHW
jgi:hypothetical protein